MWIKGTALVDEMKEEGVEIVKGIGGEIDMITGDMIIEEMMINTGAIEIEIAIGIDIGIEKVIGIGREIGTEIETGIEVDPEEMSIGIEEIDIEKTTEKIKVVLYFN